MEFFFEGGADVLIDALWDAKSVAGHDDGAVAVGIFEGEDLNPEVGGFAFGGFGAAGITGEPHGFGGGDVGGGGASKPGCRGKCGSEAETNEQGEMTNDPASRERMTKHSSVYRVQYSVFSGDRRGIAIENLTAEKGREEVEDRKIRVSRILANRF